MSWGPEPIGDGRWRFRLWAPDRAALTLELRGARLPMRRDADGWFHCEADAAPGDRYRFRLDEALAVPDPAARAQAGDVHGDSLIVDPDSYRWRHPDWRGRPWREAVIYEVHAGLMGGFAGVAARLPALAELGVTAIELMPVAEVSGTRNWGYDGVLPYAPARAFGSPDDLKALIDRAHGLGLMMILDVVYNHFGPDGNYLGAYAGPFFDAGAPTPWGAAIDFSRPQVRDFFLDNARMWIADYRFDGLRLDAVHAIGDPGFLDALSEACHAAAGPDRALHLILENEENDAARLPAPFRAQWNDDFHNSLHVLLTGEAEGYYRAFADRPAERLARVLAEGFCYQGETPPGADKPRGSPSGHLPPTAFVSFLQNHDQIGNRALGERLIALTDPARLRAATALLLLCPQIPLLFMGEEDGATTPFLFFTDFHDDLADAVRDGRRREFARFTAFADPAARARIPDPNAPATFARSRPEPGPDGAAWRALYAELLALRAAEITPWLDDSAALGAEALEGSAVRAAWRLGPRRLTLYANLGKRAAPFPDAPATAPIFALGELGAPGSFAAWIAPA